MSDDTEPTTVLEPEPQPTPPPATDRWGPKTVTVPTLVLGSIVLAGAGYAVGYAIGHDDDRARGPVGAIVHQGEVPQFERGNGGPKLEFEPGEKRGEARGRNAVSGEITAVSDDQLTLETDDGETLTVTLEDDTRVLADAGGLEKGDQVVVRGQRDDDTVDAKLVAETPDVS